MEDKIIMKGKSMYYVPEAIGTILWLIMDFNWLSKNYGTALLCMMLAIVFLGIATSNTFFNKDCKISERLNFVASWTWCIMNSFWFISDMPFESSTDKNANEIALISAKVAFVIASALVLASIVFSFIEKSQLNFKRLNINLSGEKEEKPSVDSKFNESLNKSNLKIQ